ncbi:MAG: hypothetical protein BWZ02_01721 [Lentisphaerae bacterium ADurb.BinA184]|nr:MAG: hypothetical protein BWZ02_01721 [Lentisphaerae bacterium ADurb.BinA184]
MIHGRDVEIEVVAGHVQEGEQLVVIHGREDGSHAVGADKGARMEAAEQLGLKARVLDHHVAPEPLAVEVAAGVQALGGVAEADLPPVAVVHAPEAGLPRLAEGVETAVAFAQPGLEPGLAVLAVAPAGLGPELVVQLPADDVLVWPQLRGQGGDHAGGMAAVGFRGRAVMPARTVLGAAAVGAHQADVGIGLGQPGGGGGGGGAHHHVNAVAAQGVQALVQPVERETPLLGFEAAPGELADAGDVDAGLGHQPGVGLETLRPPVLRVVGTAKILHGSQTSCSGGTGTDRPK